jgi:catechol 2,3-dioxygenase-like lactoylglutathione lyase family enzyme
MIPLKRLHHVSFAVSDLEKSRQFFGSVIGLPEIPRPAFNFRGAWFAIGDRQLHLIEQPSAGREPAGRISRSDHMALEVTDIGAAKEALDAAGIAFQTGGNEALGFSQLFCPDPDGHTIEFVQYFDV